VRSGFQSRFLVVERLDPAFEKYMSQILSFTGMGKSRTYICAGCLLFFLSVRKCMSVMYLIGSVESVVLLGIGLCEPLRGMVFK